MTPTQLRAFACVVRHGSVKGAAEELGITEPAVSMHLKQLRTELDDPLFSRTPSGLAFTPGGLRLASRASEILDLQSRTVIEVSEAGHGRRMLRLASSDLFAEHAAPGLISLFTSRARDLDVELSVHPVSEFHALCRLAHGGRRARAGSEGSRRTSGAAAVPLLRRHRGGRHRSTRRPPARWRSTSCPARRGTSDPGPPALPARPRGCCVGWRSPRTTNASSRATPPLWPRPGAGWACRSRWGSPSGTTCATTGSCGSTPHTW